MANISIIQECNRQCGYCFANTAAPAEPMRIEHFRQILDLLARSGVREVRLLGGEPTLHPQLAEFVRESLDRDFNVMVFSNGLMPSASLDAIVRSGSDRVGALLNIPCPEEGGREGERLRATCSALGQRARIGINIHRRGMPLSSMLDLIDECGLKRSVRLGLAHPRIGGSNDYLPPREYPAVGRDIHEFALVARERGVKLVLDCGFVPCMFPRDFFAVAGQDENRCGHCCGPIPDVMPDLSSVHCYALAELDQVPIAGAQTRQELVDIHHRRVAELRRLGIYRHCDNCDYRRSGRCQGGCLAAAIRPVHRAAPVAVAEDAPTVPARRQTQRWVIPYIDQPASFWSELIERYGQHIHEVYFPLPVAGIGSGRPAQPAEHLSQFLAHEGIPKSVLVNPVVLPAPVEQIGPAIVDCVAALAEEHGITSVTVCDVQLATMIRTRLPRLRLVASTLLEVTDPAQILALAGLFDVLVPATRILRNQDRLKALRQAFPGKLRLLLNEGCLPACSHRRQHFYEMATSAAAPASLCGPLLLDHPWLRLTGAWVLPQHRRLYDGVVDEYKLAGRVTLRRPADYLRVLDAYVHGTALWPDQIGGGPASLLGRIPISEATAGRWLNCGARCHECHLCRRLAASEPADAQTCAIPVDEPAVR